MLELIIFGVCLFGLLVGSYTDLKTREVPDWVNYGLIFTGLGLNLIFSVVYNDYRYIMYSGIGLLLFIGFGYMMYYAGQWGGGDSKMLMGLGSLLGFKLSFSDNFLFDFFLNILIVGAAYGIMWTLFLVAFKFKKFRPAFAKEIKSKKTVRKYALIFCAITLLVALLVNDKSMQLSSLWLAIVTYVTLYLLISVRAVEKSCMMKMVDPEQLTEGDWIAADVYVKGKYIAGPKDLGIGKKQISLLRKLSLRRKLKIQIKEGIPFVPSFLIAFAVTLAYGNLIWLLAHL